MQHENPTELGLSRDSLRELAEAVLRKNRLLRIQARGHSMSPIIRNGDIIVISPLRDRKPGYGDVLAFVHQPCNSLTVHRMIHKQNDRYYFRGDNCLGSPEMATADQLLGRLSGVERNGIPIRFGLGPERLLIGLLNRKQGFAYLIRSLRRTHRLLRSRIR